MRGSNPRPLPCQGSALPAELIDPMILFYHIFLKFQYSFIFLEKYPLIHLKALVSKDYFHPLMYDLSDSNNTQF